jgi:hypothetical protein
MTTETKLRLGMVISVLLLLWTTVMWNNDITTINSQKNAIDDLNKSFDSVLYLKDSLYDENFIKSVELGRDELTWDYVKEKFPSVYNNAMNFRSHETE